ncbi:MAG: PQQ-binding-like beta-propeller repeat protein [Planctomycetes bacterium]|nr:PQQ-binding-like beta-propeller repeat protein [Planctomycetota bacterium]
MKDSRLEQLSTLLSRQSATGRAPNLPDRFAIRSEIARGGQGTVLEVFDRALNRTVAVKILRDADERGSYAARKFVEEALVGAQLEHPNILPVYDVGLDAQGTLYFAMRRIYGRSLRTVLDELLEGNADTAREFTLTRRLQVFLHICNAVAYAHSRGIIHRDLKPDNVMIGPFGEVLVTDWGLSKRLRSQEPRADGATLWKADSKDVHAFSLSPDVDGDATPEVVFFAEKQVRMLSGRSGATLWTVETDEWFDRLYMPGDILLAGSSGVVALSKTDGKTLWQFRPPGWMASRVGFGNHDRDGIPDVWGDERGSFLVVSGKDGRLLQRIQGSSSNVSVKEWADVDLDGMPDAVCSMEGGVFLVLSGKDGGRICGPMPGVPLSITCVDEDKAPDVLATGKDCIHIYSGATGAVLADLPVARLGAISPRTVDGAILVKSEDRKVLAMDWKTGRTLWTFNARSEVVSTTPLGRGGVLVCSRSAVYAVESRAPCRDFARIAPEARIHIRPSLVTLIEWGRLVAVALDGRTIFATPFSGNPDDVKDVRQAGDDLLLVTAKGVQRVLSPSGQSAWTLDAPEIRSSHLVSSGPLVLSFASTLRALSTEDGCLLWESRLAPENIVGVRRLADSRLVVWTTDGAVALRDPFTGQEVWRTECGFAIGEVLEAGASLVIAAARERWIDIMDLASGTRKARHLTRGRLLGAWAKEGSPQVLFQCDSDRLEDLHGHGEAFTEPIDRILATDMDGDARPEVAILTSRWPRSLVILDGETLRERFRMRLVGARGEAEMHIESGGPLVIRTGSQVWTVRDGVLKTRP